MYCQKCNAQNPDDANSCVSCGSALTGGAVSSGAEKKTSGLAIASLVLGILSPLTCLITALPAVICGIISLVKIGSSKGQLKGIGLAVTGIALPIVVLPVVAMVLAIAMPAVSRAKQVAERVVCAQNMKQINLAIHLYTVENDNQFPTAKEWYDLIELYIGKSAREITRCPVESQGTFSYAFNQNLDGLTTEEVEPDVVMLFESEPGRNMTGGPQLVKTNRHPASDRASFGGCNIAFFDGRVEFVNADRIPKLKWIPDK